MTFLSSVLIAVAVLQPMLTVSVEPMVLQSSIPRGAQRVPMMTVQLSASCASGVPISAITLFHEGAGSAGDLARVYVLEGRTRVSRAAVPAVRDGKVTVRLRSFTIPACAKRTLAVVADIAADSTSGGEHRLVLRAGSAIETGTVNAQVHVEQGRGAGVRPVLRAVGPAQGTLSVEYLSMPLPVTYGSNRALLRLKLSADRLNDQLVTAITLTNEGKARDGDLQKLILMGSDGKQLTDEVASIDGDRLHFVFDPPLRIDRSDQRVLVLRGDVRASRRQTIEFRIEEPSDIEAEIARGRTTTAP